MIAKYFIWLLLLTVAPQWWIDRIYCRHYTPWKRFLCWLPTGIVVCYAMYLAICHNGTSDNHLLTDLWFLALGVVVIPQAIYSLCLLAKWGWCRARHRRVTGRNWIASLLACVSAAAYLYGFFWGFGQLRVKHITLAYDQLPEAFDGYRIAHISDLHVGTFQGWRSWMLNRDIDSINAQKADIILFTGDLQNFSPQEISENKAELSRLKAPDGIISVLGNHDYGKYIARDEKEKKTIERAIIKEEEGLDWTLLRSSHHIIRRGKDSIVIAGEEYDTSLDNPYKHPVSVSLDGIKPNSFLIMLEHDPEAWPSRTLPDTYASLQLSGHTHGGHIDLLGARSTRLTSSLDYGLHEREGRYLYTTRGLGGVIPLRIGAWAEIVVITLKKTSKT